MQVEKAGASSLKGPHTFVLERLLSVFWALMRAEAEVPLSQQAEASADVLGLLATLVSLRLLSQVRPHAAARTRRLCMWMQAQRWQLELQAESKRACCCLRSWLACMLAIDRAQHVPCQLCSPVAVRQT